MAVVDLASTAVDGTDLRQSEAVSLPVPIVVVVVVAVDQAPCEKYRA